MVHKYDMNTDLQGSNCTIQPYGLICHNNTKFVHIGEAVATKYCAMHVDFYEINSIV